VDLSINVIFGPGSGWQCGDEVENVLILALDVGGDAAKNNIHWPHEIGYGLVQLDVLGVDKFATNTTNARSMDCLLSPRWGLQGIIPV